MFFFFFVSFSLSVRAPNDHSGERLLLVGEESRVGDSVRHICLFSCISVIVNTERTKNKGLRKKKSYNISQSEPKQALFPLFPSERQLSLSRC